MKITVETAVNAGLNAVWTAWNSSVDLREGGTFSARMEAKDGSESRVLVRETFDAESGNAPELQRPGWQAILDNFARHVEGNRP